MSLIQSLLDLEKEKNLLQEDPSVCAHWGCQRWLILFVLKAEGWRFSSILPRPSSCAANCLGPAEKYLFKWAWGLFACKADIWCSLQHKAAVSCITVTGHWAAQLMHRSCSHHSSAKFNASLSHFHPVFMQISGLFWNRVDFKLSRVIFNSFMKKVLKP